MTASRGLGDRWLAGERVEGIGFAHHQRVSIVEGPHAGRSGTVALLLAVTPEPLYLVSVTGAGEVRVRQSALHARGDA